MNFLPKPTSATVAIQLTTTSSFLPWKKASLEHFNFHFGKIGQNLRNGLLTTLPLIGDRPSALDPALHPRTHLPTEFSQYPKIDPTAAQLAASLEGAFDLESLPLTQESNRLLRSDQAAYDRALVAHKAEFKELKLLDDQACAYIYETLSPQALTQLKISPEGKAFESLDSACFTRAACLFEALRIVFSKGNAQDAVDSALQLFNATQSPTEAHTAFIDRVQELLANARAHLSGPNDTLSFATFQTLALLAGLNKEDPANQEAVREFFRQSTANTAAAVAANAPPTAPALNNPQDLIDIVLRIHQQGLHKQPHVSEQSSTAYSASSSPAPSKSQSKPKSTIDQRLKPDREATRLKPDGRPDYTKPRKDSSTSHCPLCFRLLKLYFYHQASACNKFNTDGSPKDKPMSASLAAPPQPLAPPALLLPPLPPHSLTATAGG